MNRISDVILCRKFFQSKIYKQWEDRFFSRKDLKWVLWASPSCCSFTPRITPLLRSLLGTLFHSVDSLRALLSPWFCPDTLWIILIAIINSTNISKGGHGTEPVALPLESGLDAEAHVWETLPFPAHTFSFHSVACTNTMTTNTQERRSFVPPFRSLSITEESLGRSSSGDLKQETWRKLLAARSVKLLPA